MDLFSAAAVGIYASVAVTSVVSTSLGFGSAALVPIFALAFGPKHGIVLLTLYFLCFNIVALHVFRGNVDWRFALRLSMFAIPGALVGGLILIVVRPRQFSALLGGALLVYLGLRHLPARRSQTRPPTMYATAVFGFCYGIASGATGSGNAIKGPFFSAAGLRKERYVATYAATSLLINVPKSVLFLGLNTLPLHVYYPLLPLIAVSYGGSLIGRSIVLRVSDRLFARLIDVVFIVTAVVLLVSG